MVVLMSMVFKKEDLESKKFICVGYCSTGHAALIFCYRGILDEGFALFKDMVVSDYPVNTSIAIRRYIYQGLMIRLKRATYKLTPLGIKIAKQLPMFPGFQKEYIHKGINFIDRIRQGDFRRNFPKYYLRFDFKTGEMIGDSLTKKREERLIKERIEKLWL